MESSIQGTPDSYGPSGFLEYKTVAIRKALIMQEDMTAPTALNATLIEQSEESNVFSLDTPHFDEAGLRAKLEAIGGYSQEVMDKVVSICYEEWQATKYGNKLSMADRQQAINAALQEALLKMQAKGGDDGKFDRRRRRAGKAGQRASRLADTLVSERTTPKERKELAKALKKGKLRLKR